MDERAQVAWLARRVGFGLTPGQLDEWEAKGAAAVLDELTDPDANGVPTAPDPFAGLAREREENNQVIRDAIVGWFDVAATGPRPLETWMQFFWHDFFAVSAQAVPLPGLMFDHLNLLRNLGMGNYRDLLRHVTTDGAMLAFLNGTQSTGDSPNENYGREMLELYSVGVGNFTEDDVRAASIALTGWVIRPRFDGEVVFVRRRHDDTPQTLLGVDGVHDVDTVIDAVMAHPGTAQRVTRLLARAILGATVDQALVDRHAADFARTLEIRPLVRGLLEDGLDGAATDVIVQPVPWLVSAVRATGGRPEGRAVPNALRAAGQIPLLPPNVGGFPPPMSYLSTSATVARFNLASAIASSARPQTPAVIAAEAGDLDALAQAFGLVDGFSEATREALSFVDRPVDRLAAALASPDMVVA